MGGIDEAVWHNPWVTLPEVQRTIDQAAVDELNILLTGSGRLFGCKAGREFPGTEPEQAVLSHLNGNGLDDFPSILRLPKAFLDAAIHGAEIIREEEAYIKGENS